jgi:MoxR-like ATPase
MNRLDYQREFNPDISPSMRPTQDQNPSDSRTSAPYVYTEKIILAVNVALATGRPLLVRGSSGTGKSTLAWNAREVLGWRFYERVVTSRTHAKDLLWEVDHLKRLQDAETGNLSDNYGAYIKPGVLWWAFNPKQASDWGDDPWQGQASQRAVVLIDEIDKADPDVPNNLLVPLGSLMFQVEETVTDVCGTDNPPLVFITTNEERELPKAFLRRCVEVKLELPSPSRLENIAKTHFAESADDLIFKVKKQFFPDEDAWDSPQSEDGISPAEFIDTIRACRKLDPMLQQEVFQLIKQTTVWKHGQRATS